MITAIYDEYENVGLYTLPLLIYHPAQIIFGAYISPKLAKMVAESKEEETVVVPANSSSSIVSRSEEGTNAKDVEMK